MPRKPPAEPIDHHYDIPRLNRAFTWTGGILTAVFIWMVIADYQRDWKTIQRTFMRLDRQLTRESALAARRKAIDHEHAKLVADLKTSRAEITRQAGNLRKAEAKVRELDPQIYGADQSYKFTKAAFDAALYKYEDALANKPKAAASARKDLEALRKDLEERTVRLAQLKQQEAAAKTEIDLINVRKQDIETTIEKRTAEFRLARSKFTGLKQDTLFNLRNSPILDMVNPSLRIQQVQLPDHFINVNFMRIPRVDRCTTCHIAADRKGFEDPRIKNDIFRTHPRMHRMVGSESMHPATTFGCTPCHGGRDRATSFWSAGHSPETEAEKASWTEKWDWRFDRFNDTPVLPLQYAQAGCYRCHAKETNFPEAPRLDAGMRIVESLGCWGCHRVEGLEKQGLPRVGPSLERVAAKVPRDWTARWVMDPAAFRPNTKMPTFFYLENFVDVSGPRKPDPAQQKMNEQGRVENDTMVNAIVAYLYDRSRPVDVPRVAGRGDATRGAKLIAERGCFGCHEADLKAQRDLTGTYRQFGPNLAGVGSKASRDWIYHWIRDPKAWNPDTKMPNLRLTESDALDIAEYLVTLKGPDAFGGTALPKTDEKVLDSIALYFEMSTKTLFDAKAELAKMDLQAKEVYAGRNLIAHYGCYACHAIPGFEDAKPIGTELTEEGSKAVHRLDFGFIHIPHTRHDWFRTKLHEPRIFDRDRARGWEEKLRMPNFRLSPRELDQAVTAVLGFQQLNAAPNVVKQLSPAEAAIERGRRIVKDNNCQGCHVIEGFGGSFRSLVADASLAPPIIQGEGAKVQSDWLFGFLEAPKTGEIRPWLEVHMPTFGFTDAELNDLTLYFASLDRASYPFLVAEGDGSAANWAAGRKVFELLKCAQCHPRSLEDMNRPGVDRSTLAPNLQMAAKRLRHDWIADWIRRPDEWMPGTRMPTNFPKGDDGHRFSPLTQLFDAPSFAADRADFARILGGDARAKQFLSSPEEVTRALGDYVWSIGVNGGTAPVEPRTPPAAQSASRFGSPAPAGSAVNFGNPRRQTSTPRVNAGPRPALPTAVGMPPVAGSGLTPSF